MAHILFERIWVLSVGSLAVRAIAFAWVGSLAREMTWKHAKLHRVALHTICRLSLVRVAVLRGHFITDVVSEEFTCYRGAELQQKSTKQLILPTYLARVPVFGKNHIT